MKGNIWHRHNLLTLSDTQLAKRRAWLERELRTEREYRSEEDQRLGQLEYRRFAAAFVRIVRIQDERSAAAHAQQAPMNLEQIAAAVGQLRTELTKQYNTIEGSSEFLERLLDLCSEMEIEIAIYEGTDG